jgi:RNA polymerase-binding transcription factor DksA
MQSSLEIEAGLRARLTALRAGIRTALLRMNDERFVDIADSVHDTKDKSLADLLADVSSAEIARDLSEISDIEVAMGRLEAGTYGHCAQCDAAIPGARLRAYPSTTRCLACQTAYERQAASEART